LPHYHMYTHKVYLLILPTPTLVPLAPAVIFKHCIQHSPSTSGVWIIYFIMRLWVKDVIKFVHLYLRSSSFFVCTVRQLQRPSFLMVSQFNPLFGFADSLLNISASFALFQKSVRPLLQPHHFASTSKIFL
jgi:hypothetical protein